MNKFKEIIFCILFLSMMFFIIGGFAVIHGIMNRFCIGLYFFITSTSLGYFLGFIQGRFKKGEDT